MSTAVALAFGLAVALYLPFAIGWLVACSGGTFVDDPETGKYKSVMNPLISEGIIAIFVAAMVVACAPLIATLF